jgi:DNA replication protein DnaC
MSAAEMEILRLHLRALRMPSALAALESLLEAAQRDDWSPEYYTRELLERELEGRRQRRIERLLLDARLPPGKTAATLDLSRLPRRLARQFKELSGGDFVARADNVLIFGLPGRGKTHFAAAVGHELVHQGRRVLFTPTFKVVDRLQRARRDLELERELRRLDGYDVLILDDIGYVQQSRDEMEVLFTLLAERYERRSVIITSNLVFSEWDRIFKDPLTTAAAIDRVVHHSVIVEFGQDTHSLRAEEARKRNANLQLSPSTATA